MSAHDSLVHACIQLLALHKIPAYAINQVSSNSRNGVWRTPGAPIGFPDIVACLPSPKGRLLAIEVKTGKSKPRAEQQRVLAELKLAGAEVAVITKIDQLQGLLEGFRVNGWWAEAP